MLDPTSFPQYVFGMDSSVWDDINETPQRPDFQKAYDRGCRFDYHRASFGLSKDTDFDVNWKNSRNTPLLLGAYHFLVWTQSPEAQADFFWSIVKDDPGDLPLIVDFEWWSTIPSDAFNLLYRFLERMKLLTNKKLGLYTATSFWKQYGRTSSYWKQYVLWLAHYNDTPPTGTDIPAPWTECKFWQFTGHGDGLYYGMESKDVDLDFFMGTWGELLDFCDLGEKFMYKENAIGLYTPDATWTNTGHHFIVGFAGESWYKPNDQLKAIEEKAHKEGKPFIALYKFNIDFYIRNQYPMDEDRWPSPTLDEPFQMFVRAMMNRDVQGIIVEVMNEKDHDGKVHTPAWVSFAAQQFVGRCWDWTMRNKPKAKFMIGTSNSFISAKAPNMNNWANKYDNCIYQPATMDGSYPKETEKPQYISTHEGWNIWKYYDYTTKPWSLMLYNGKPGAMYTWLSWTGSTPADTQAPTTPVMTTEYSYNVSTRYTVKLAWSPSSDNVAVTGYNVYMNDVKLATQTEYTYIISGLEPGQVSFGVEAFDAAGNVSPQAGEVIILPAVGGADDHVLELRVEALENQVADLKNRLREWTNIIAY